VPRWTVLLLIAALVAGVSGVLPAAAAAGDCCADSCAEDQDAVDPLESDGCEESDGHGDGMGCPPLCSSCVCAAYFAPAMLPAALDVRVAAASCDLAPGIIACPESAPASSVFHPPRAA
jgi:hypothetical protein